VNIGVDARKAFDSGIGVVIRALLEEFQDRDVKVSAVCKSHDQAERLRILLPGLRYLIASAENYSIGEQFAIPLAARGDVLWSPHYNVPVGVGMPVVSTVHDLLPLAYPQLFPGLRKQVYARLMFRLCAFKSAAIVCVSHFTALELGRFTRCPTRKIRVVHNGVAPRWFGLRREPDPADPFFLYVGNFKPHKNLNRLLAGFEKASLIVPHRLVVVGQSEGFITSDQEAIQRAKDTPRVTFAGSVSDERLDKLMAGASAVILPSVYEGFGLPALEALAAGVPVVASDIPPLKEVCGETAIYCDAMSIDSIADALSKAASLPELQQRELTDLGRRQARLFSWEKAGQAYLEICEEVAASRRRAKA
jgi:glycosyltransferase involved in cell wall biosynthesis